MVLLRKNVPQNHNLKTAAELGVGQKICRCEKIRSVRIFLVDKDTHCAYNLLKQ
jgi:hypothetical protein